MYHNRQAIQPGSIKGNTLRPRLRHIRKTLQGCTLGVFLAVSAYAANGDNGNDNAPFSRHNVGAGAGFTTGVGLSYRHWFENTWGVQVNVLPYIKSADTYRNVLGSIGLTGLKIFNQSHVVNLFGYAGAHLWYDEVATRNSANAPWSGSTPYAMITLGAGPGIDIHFWKLSLNFMAGIAGSRENTNSWGMRMTGETALYYSF